MNSSIQNKVLRKIFRIFILFYQLGVSPLVGMENVRLEVDDTPVAKENKQNSELDTDLISRLIGSFLIENIQSPLDLRDVGKIVGKHLLCKEAAAFLAKQFKTRSEEIGSDCSKPFEINDHRFAMRDRKERVVIADLTTGKRVHRLAHTEEGQQQDSSYYKARAHEGGDLLITVARDLTAKVWDVAGGGCRRSIVDEEPILDAQFAQLENETKIIITHSLSWVKVWSLETGVCLQTFQFHDSKKAEKAKEFGHPQYISGVVIHKTCSKILITYEGYYPIAEVWSLNAGNLICTLEEEFDFSGGEFSPCGTYIITINENASSPKNALKLWSANTGYLLDTEVLRWSYECKIFFDGTGKKILVLHGINDEDSAEEDGVKLFTIKNGGKLNQDYFSDSAHGCVQLATFNRTGDLLLTASKKNAEIRRVADTKKVHQLLGHKEPIISLSFNKAGDQALTCDCKNTMLIWSVESGLCLTRISFDGYKAFFLADTVISRTYDDTRMWFIDSIHTLLSGLTLDQAFIINAIYEVIIIRRLAMLREAAIRCRSFMDDQAIASLTHCLSGSFAADVQKVLKAGDSLLKKLSASPSPIVTENNQIVSRENLVFDFNGKPEKLRVAFKTLPEQIRQIVGMYVKATVWQ